MTDVENPLMHFVLELFYLPVDSNHALFVYIPTSSLLLSFEQEAASDVLWNPTPTLQRSLVFLGQIYIFE